MWINMKRILLWCCQDEAISSMAHTFIIFSIPDLIFLSLLHIYLRTQSVTLSMTYCSAVFILLHIPLDIILVIRFKMGVAGVAIAMIWTNLNLLPLLFSFVYFSDWYKDSWVSPSINCLKGRPSLLALAIPTCVFVCLEWWCYGFMILLCGLLVNPKATIASIGILIQTTTLVYAFPSSLSLRVSTIVLVAALGLAAMCFPTLMPHHWGRIFTADSEILELTTIALLIASLCELSDCPQTTGSGVSRGSARLTIGANINLGSFYLVGMAIFKGFQAKMGFSGLWIGLVAAQTSCALLIIYVLLTNDWIVEAEKARALTNQWSSTNWSLPIMLSDGSNEKEEGYKKKSNLEEIVCINGKLETQAREWITSFHDSVNFGNR